MERDIKSNLQVGYKGNLLVKTATDKTAYSDAIDTKGCKGYVIGIVPIDSNTGLFYTKNKYDDVELILQDSDDNVNFTDVDEEKQFGSRVFEESVHLDCQRIGLVSNERYIRLKVIGNHLETLGNNELILGLMCIGEKYERPVE